MRSSYLNPTNRHVSWPQHRARRTRCAGVALTPVIGLSTSRMSNPWTGDRYRERCPIARRVSGATLWSIAAEIAPDSDPRPVVHALRAANGGPDVQVGERLIIRTD